MNNNMPNNNNGNGNDLNSVSLGSIDVGNVNNIPPVPPVESLNTENTVPNTTIPTGKNGKLSIFIDSVLHWPLRYQIILHHLVEIHFIFY